ncbi:MAG: BatA domain-containing protein [Phycisphaerales bacterium]
MTFVTAGLAIAGLCAIAIPIIIHLLARQRRRPIEWAAMRFLLEALRKNKRRLQLEQIILLALRCLIVGLLGFALARPLLEAAGVIGDERDRVVLFVIDNGLASSARMGETDRDGTALDHHVRTATSIIESLSETDPVGIITASRPAASPLLPPSLDHAAAIKLLASLTPSEAPTDVTAALRRAQQFVAERQRDGLATAVYLLSDFRRGSVALDEALPRLFSDEADDSSSGKLTTLIASPPAATAIDNVQVVAIEPVRELIVPGAADGSQQVTVRLMRHGQSLQQATSRVRLNGPVQAGDDARTVQWEAGSQTASVTFTLDLEQAAGSEVGLTATVEPAAGDAIAADNRAFVTLDVREKLRVAMISPPTFERIGLIERLTPGQWIRRALRTSETSAMDIFDVAPGSLDAIDLRGVDVAIVVRPDRVIDTGWKALRDFVDNGGLAMILPPDEVNVHTWLERMTQTLDLPWRFEMETDEHTDGMLMAAEQPRSEIMRLLWDELDDLVRPIVVQKRLAVVADDTQATVVLNYGDGKPFMIAGSPGMSNTGADEHGNAAGADAGASTPPDSQGMVVMLTTTPSFPGWTNLPTQMFFVPLFQETVRQGANLIMQKRRIQVGDHPALAGVDRRATSLRPEGGSTEDGSSTDSQTIALDAALRPSQPFTRAGLYTVMDAAAQNVGTLAVNVDARAARTDTHSEVEVSNWLATSGDWSMFAADDPAAQLRKGAGGQSIAGMLLVIVMLLALLETVLARWFSHARRSTLVGRDVATGLKPTMT